MEFFHEVDTSLSVDLTIRLDLWKGMDAEDSALIQLDSNLASNLMNLAQNQNLTLDDLLHEMVAEYLGARFGGQVYPDSERDVPRSDSSVACQG